MNIIKKRARINEMISEADRRISELESGKCRFLRKRTTSDEVEKEKERLYAIKALLKKSLSHYEAKQTIGDAVNAIIFRTLGVRHCSIHSACDRCGIDKDEEYLPDKFRKHIIVAAIYAINDEYPIECLTPYRKDFGGIRLYREMYRERVERAIEELKLLLFLP